LKREFRVANCEVRVVSGRRCKALRTHRGRQPEGVHYHLVSCSGVAARPPNQQGA
jgi:hypothetical protein